MYFTVTGYLVLIVRKPAITTIEYEEIFSKNVQTEIPINQCYCKSNRIKIKNRSDFQCFIVSSVENCYIDK